MNEPQFSILPNMKQLDRLHKHGVYIGKRKILGSTILLYQYQSFYVEIFYTHYRKVVADIRVSSSISVLDPYLPQVGTPINWLGGL